MTTPLESELRNNLRELANEPGPTDLADLALEGARRARRRRVAAAAVGTLALTGAIAAPVFFGGFGTEPGMTGGAGSSQTPGASTAEPTSTMIRPTPRPDPRTLAPPVVTTAGCAAAAPSGPPPPGGQHPNMAGLMEVFERFGPAITTRFGAVYAGLQLDLDRNRIQLFRKPSADLDRFVAREFAADCIEVYDAKYSEAEGNARIASITTDMLYWHERGIDLGMFRFEKVAGVVVIGVLGDVDEAREQVPARYGPGIPLEFEKTYPISW